jgi:DNA-binding FadR family transcriptional regulator
MAEDGRFAALGSPGRRVRPQKMADLVANRIREIIARGELKDGEWLPTEAELMARLGVSRPTLREAFRLLEADSLVTIRRGPPGGARVTVPGPEAAASLFGLLLTLSGTTLADVYTARAALEPAAVRRLVECGSEQDRRALAAEVDVIRAAAPDPVRFSTAMVRFHQRVVELSGNRTLGTVAGMLVEIVNRHHFRTYRRDALTGERLRIDHARILVSYQRLLELVDAGDADGAEQHWVEFVRSPGPNGDAEDRVVDLIY